MIKLLIPTALLLTLSISNVQADNTENGKQLHDENCVKCHGSEVYTRPNRRVTSFAALHKQVRFCEQNLGLTWFDDQIEGTVNHLNQEYYKFNTKP